MQVKQEASFGYRLIAPIALGSMLNPINSTMIATALVPIARDFQANVAQTGWLIAALYLTSAIAQPTMGRLADRFGPRRVYLICLMLVAIAGLLGAVMSSLTGLVCVRVLLGIGTSGAYPAAMRIFRVQADRLRGEPPRSAMGLLSMGGTATLAIGPFLGGVLTSTFGWHAIFLVNAPFALAIIALVLLWVPRDEQASRDSRHLLDDVDVLGIAIFTAFLLSLMTFLLKLDHPNWFALVAAVFFCAGLVKHSLKRRRPFIDVRMLTANRALRMTYLRAGAMLMMVYCILYGFAQWLESAAGFSEQRAGLITMPMSIVAALTSFAGTRPGRVRTPFLISIGSGIVGCLCLLMIDSATDAWLIAVAVIGFAAPQGMFSTATQTAVYMQARTEDIGTAAGLQRTAQYLGAIAATSLLGLTYGQHATDQGLHRLALIMGVLGAVLLVWTLSDRTLRYSASQQTP
ncbi:MFS transporter [Pandoraea fibrosis]|uniref:MFS transporter n=1 Tax=Pandoraea fibrosis TaxID=1891094 RepID=A0ABX6HQS2_9BURK|nr:MFS transporter [Pandoraea fibrosis]QHE93222.1 MFS transporter [Pandoraea fibrosis]QHF13219.1 MFS transporter [Pandoraea fibrosis]